MAKLGRESSATGSFLQIADGAAIVKNDDTVQFDDTVSGESLDKTLTTESFGGISQASDAVISGTNADQYSVVTQPTLELYPTETDSFTLRFSPLSAGIQQAVVQVSGRSFSLSGLGVVGVVGVVVLDQYANFTRSSGAYHTQPDGSPVLVNPDEPRWVGALRVDHADGIDYGFGALGIEYQPDGAAPFPILIEPAAENLFTNPDAPATQTITPAAGTYTVQCWGTGSIVLSGDATGTVTEGNPVTVTTTGASVTATVTGCDQTQFEPGSVATSFTDAPRTAGNLAYCLEGLPGMAEDNISIEYIDSSNVVRCAKITNTGYIVGVFHD